MRNASLHSSFWALLLATGLFALGAKADNLAGVLQKKDGSFFIHLASTNQVYAIANMSAEASESLIKLESGDYINGSGDVDEKGRKVSLKTLDYVGLKKLLGIWYSGDAVMNFSSFNQLSVYPFGAGFKNINIAIPPAKNDFRYSTAPYYGERWALFLSDNVGTTFATLEMGADSATLRTFSPQTGAVLRTLRLVRWGL